ncbi:MAG: M1 family peptidase, partial [Acidobacteriota bacterium]|nr:M1 family peptidase [Acidobacteriota bacterium]
MSPRLSPLTNLLCVLCVLCGPIDLSAQTAAPAQRREPPSTLRAPTRLDVLRGEYGRYRANNDLLHYALDVRVDPEKRSITGTNAIRFKMLTDDTRIQLELYA